MKDSATLELVRKSRTGCEESLNKLAESVQDGLYTYLYRMTLDHNLSNDIRQETLLEMCRSIKNLRKATSFNAWLYRTAWGKLKHHYRTNKKHKHMSISDKNDFIDSVQGKKLEGLRELVSKELAGTIIDAIDQLTPGQKNVFILRCYDQLSYHQIADIMNCSEISARVQFYRARNILKSKLSKKGIGKALLLPILGIFGTATASSTAAITVTATTLNVGFFTTAAATVMSKAGIGLLSLIMGLGLIVSSTAFFNTIDSENASYFDKKSVKSFHYFKQSWDQAHIPNANLIMGASLSKGAYEQWYFFPEGVDGPMFKMTQRWDPTVKNKLCGWMQNADGNYYYHSGENKIYHYGVAMPSSSAKTQRLPADSEEFTEFLDEMEGAEEGIEYTRDPKTGLLTGILDTRFYNAKDFKSSIEYNNLNETEFGSFRYKWPDADYQDMRGPIEQQNWISFEITGNIAGRNITGKGQMPLVYNMRHKITPFLELSIGDDYKIIDSKNGAVILNKSNKPILTLPPLAFFKGLSRPWFGMHAMDTIRRDAAEKFIPFESTILDRKDYYYSKMNIELYDAADFENIRVLYSIDVDHSRINKITFSTKNGSSLGHLEFIYPDSPENLKSILEMPEYKTGKISKRNVGPLWLFGLTQDDISDF